MSGLQFSPAWGVAALGAALVEIRRSCVEVLLDHARSFGLVDSAPET